MKPNKLHLEALSKFLKELADHERFNMRYYARGPDGEIPKPADSTITECGTVACAAGHGVFLFPAKPNENWSDYIERVFGVEPHRGVWIFLFSPYWANFDNTPLGAAKRIDYYLRTGKLLPVRRSSVDEYQ